MAQRRPLKILFVHHRSELGGAPTSLSYLIRALDRERFEPHVFCPPGQAAELFAEVGATVHTGSVAAFTHIWASVYRGRRWLLFVRDLLRLPQHVHAFERTLRETRFDLVHLNDSPLVPAAFLARRRGIPLVWHLRSSLPDNGVDMRSRFMRATIRRLAAAAVAINEDVAAVFDVGADVIQNSVDLQRFHPGDEAEARTALELPADRPIVSFFGFIYPSKGFREFIAAAAELQRRGHDLTYGLVGGAVRPDSYFRTAAGRLLLTLDLAHNYEKEAIRLVREQGLEDAVRFVPFTRTIELLYRASRVVVAPSRGPELGRPVIEAAASGVPVVATGSQTGAGIVVPGVTATLVSTWEATALVDAIESYLADPELRQRTGERARHHAEEYFDAVTNARRIELIYDRVLPPASDRTKVLFIHHRPQLGGAPSSLAHLIRNLDPRFEPHVLVPEGATADLFEQAGATVHRGPVAIFAHAWDNPYAGARWLVLLREFAALPGHLRGMNQLMREHSFPIVHLNDSPLLPAACIAHRHGAHVVWHLRSALAGEGRDLRSRCIARLMDRWGTSAIAIDTDVALRFPLKLPVTIVHNAAVAPSTRPDQAQARAKLGLGLAVDGLTVGFAGFVRRQKGWQELVAAARILAATGVPVQFVIMGGGVRPPSYFRTPRGRLLEWSGIVTDEESAIHRAVQQAGLEGMFSFLPFRYDTAEMYAALDILTFPNQGIGLGRPVLEAAMHGKPVIASGSRDGAGVLIPETTGILLHEATPAAIAAAIARLAADPALRIQMGAAAREHAAYEFDPARLARAVEAVYDGLLAETTSRRR